MSRSRFVLLAVVTGLPATVAAQQDEPDLSFLEYLGSWQEGDEEWLLARALEQQAETEHENEDEDETEDNKADQTDEKEAKDED